MCEDCFGGEAVVVVVVVVSSERLDKKIKTNELQNYIYFSTASHFPMSVPLDWTYYDTMDYVCKRPRIQQMVTD